MECNATSHTMEPVPNTAASASGARLDAAVSPRMQMYLSPPVSQITPNLYISTLQAARNPRILNNFGITHVLTLLPSSVAIVIPGSSSSFPGNRRPGARVHHRIPLTDSEAEDLLGILPEAVEWISVAVNAGGVVLVHCSMGVSRSASVVVAWLMSWEGWTRDEALAFVKEKRRAAEPNLGFWQQLGDWERVCLRAWEDA
jgi:protein-tyrosine phosphatase